VTIEEILVLELAAIRGGGDWRPTEVPTDVRR